MCVCMYVCMYVCMHACMHGWMGGCMYACMHVCMFPSEPLRYNGYIRAASPKITKHHTSETLGLHQSGTQAQQNKLATNRQPSFVLSFVVCEVGKIVMFWPKICGPRTFCSLFSYFSGFVNLCFLTLQGP